MKTITRKTGKLLPLILLGSFGAAAALAQQPINPGDLPTPKTRTQSCANVDVNWNLDLVNEYPRIPDACHEVVTVDGTKWARFEAKFERINNDGSVTSDFRDPRGRSVGMYTYQPAPGQKALLDGRRVEFATLQRGQLLNMYVPEGAGSLAFETGVPPAQYVRIVRVEDAPMDVAVADRPRQPAPRYSESMRELPDTAGPLPLLGLGGLASLLGGLGLSLRRRRINTQR